MTKTICHLNVFIFMLLEPLFYRINIISGKVRAQYYFIKWIFNLHSISRNTISINFKPSFFKFILSIINMTIIITT